MKQVLSSFMLSSQPDLGGQSSCTLYVRGAQTRGSEHRDHVAQLEGSNDSSSLLSPDCWKKNMLKRGQIVFFLTQYILKSQI